MPPLQITSWMSSTIILTRRIRAPQIPFIIPDRHVPYPFLGRTYRSYRLWHAAYLPKSSPSHHGLMNGILPKLPRPPPNRIGKHPYTNRPKPQLDSSPKMLSECESLSRPNKALNNVIKEAEEIIKRQITDVTESPAVNNAFFSEGVKKTLSPKEKAIVLVNYAALSQRTVPGIIQTLMAIFFVDPEGLKEAVQNLHEEVGEGHGEAHFIMLERYTNVLLKEVGDSPIRKDRTGIIDDERVLSSTKRALDVQARLFSGSFFGAEPIGVKLPDKIPYWQRVAVSAVGAANENRAPFTQGGMLRWLCKQFNFAERNDLRKSVEPYFACHLGEEMTAAMFDGGNGFLSRDEWKDSTPEDLRRRGLVEFAHSKAACNTVLYLLSKETSVELAQQAFLEAQRFRGEFLENHGRFWNGLAETIEREFDGISKLSVG